MSAVACKVPADWLSLPSVCFYDWQTLITGIAAVAVGGLTIAFLRRQIDQTDRLAREERDARLTVARAKLIVPSSRLAEHARECFNELLKIAPAVFDRKVVASPLSVPTLPLDVEEALDALLANTQDKNAAFAVSAIYGEQQVLAARASDMHFNPRSHVVAFDYYCMQPLIMHALAIKLLAYSRREVRCVEPIAWEDMKASMTSLAGHTSLKERLLSFIEDKVARNKSIPFAIKEAGA